LIPTVTDLDDLAHCYEYAIQESPSATTIFRASPHMHITVFGVCFW